MKEKNKNAQALVKKRWEKTTKEKRMAHSKMMTEALLRKNKAQNLTKELSPGII